MTFSDFVESMIKTPICCELKQHIDKLYELYAKGSDCEAANKTLENKPRFILHSDGKIEQIIEPCGDVLDKIRDEICEIDDEIVLNPDSFWERKMYVRFSEVINIIDKYKTKSEANNG